MKRKTAEASDFVEAGSEDSASEGSLPSSDGEVLSAEEDSGSDVDAGVSDDEYNLRDESDGEANEPVSEDDAERAEPSGRDDGGGSSAEDAPDSPPKRGAKAKPAAGSLADAFTEILAHPGAASKRDEAPILLGSKSLAKRKAEVETETETQRAAKRLRKEMKQRGHVTVPKKGEDPEQDAIEKAFLRTATKGVVQLFNAVSKAQSKQKEAEASGAKAKDKKINKSSFFAELKGEIAKSQIPIVAEPTGKRSAGSKSRQQEAEEPGWDVLKEDFAGLQGGSTTKMKSWDKEDLSDSPPAENIDGVFSDSDSDGGLGEW